MIIWWLNICKAYAKILTIHNALIPFILLSFLFFYPIKSGRGFSLFPDFFPPSFGNFRRYFWAKIPWNASWVNKSAPWSVSSRLDGRKNWKIPKNPFLSVPVYLSVLVFFVWFYPKFGILRREILIRESIVDRTWKAGIDQAESIQTPFWEYRTMRVQYKSSWSAVCIEWCT